MGLQLLLEASPCGPAAEESAAGAGHVRGRFQKVRLIYRMASLPVREHEERVKGYVHGGVVGVGWKGSLKRKRIRFFFAAMLAKSAEEIAAPM